MILLIFKNGTKLKASEASMEQISNWIDEADNFFERQQRKQVVYPLLYGTGRSKISVPQIQQFPYPWKSK